MQSQTSDNSGLNKLKSILFLGLSCNQTTIIGCLIIWAIFSRNELSSFWHNLVTVFCFMPFFMGDAVNNYVLGRIRLEEQNDWDDIRLTSQYKTRISKFYAFYRAFSILSSYGIVAILVILLLVENSISYTELLEYLIPFVSLITFIHFALALQTMIKGIAPEIPQYKKKGLVYRVIFIILICICWYALLKKYYAIDPFDRFFVFISGTVYFILSGMMHPLPARGSLFESILRESIISQAKSIARARAANRDKNLECNLKPQDIEDASIVSSDTNVNIETAKRDVSDTNITDAVIADVSEEKIISDNTQNVVSHNPVVEE